MNYTTLILTATNYYLKLLDVSNFELEMGPFKILGRVDKRGPLYVFQYLDDKLGSYADLLTAEGYSKGTKRAGHSHLDELTKYVGLGRIAHHVIKDPATDEVTIETYDQGEMIHIPAGVPNMEEGLGDLNVLLALKFGKPYKPISHPVLRKIVEEQI